MRKIISLLTVLLVLSIMLCGCSSDNVSTSATEDEATKAVFAETEATTAVAESTQAVSSTAESSKPADETVAAEQKVTEAVNKADTSDMDFSFEDEDTKVEVVPEVTKAQTSNDSTKPAEEHINVTEITKGGTYTLKGGIKDITVTVDAGDEDVTIILDSVSIKNSKGPAIYVRSADKLILTLKDGTSNEISDGSSYSVSDSGSTLDAAIFTKSDLTINGTGSLSVKGNLKHGIVSKDDLVISSGTLSVTAKNVGLTGKDSVKINSGSITVNAGGDGIRADNATDSSKGYVYLYGGAVNITSGNDAIQAETVVNIENVDLTVVSGGGGGTKKPSDSTDSYKGIKAGSDIYVTGGSFNISALDDAIHSNGTVTIGGGAYSLTSGDDGVHADSDMLISGGALKVNTLSKGIDVNGNLSITGGNITVCTNDKAILDFDVSASISGGTFVGTGSADKTKVFSNKAQAVIAVNTGEQGANTTVKLTDSKGNVVAAFKADKPFTAVIISTDAIKSGESYTLTAGSFSKTITA